MEWLSYCHCSVWSDIGKEWTKITQWFWEPNPSIWSYPWEGNGLGHSKRLYVNIPVRSSQFSSRKGKKEFQTLEVLFWERFCRNPGQYKCSENNMRSMYRRCEVHSPGVSRAKCSLNYLQ